MSVSKALGEDQLGTVDHKGALSPSDPTPFRAESREAGVWGWGGGMAGTL